MIAARDTTAAKMLDMPRSRFLDLVEKGALPQPVVIAGEKRWRVKDLEAILDGAAMFEDFQW